MHVKFINQGISMFRGGGEEVNLNFAKELKKLGVKISFISTDPLFRKIKYPITEFWADYCTYPYMRDLSQKVPIPLVGGVLAMLDLKMFYWSCSRLLRDRHDYDILHVNGLVGIIKAIKNRTVPIVIRFPGPPSIRYRSLIKQFDAVVANGDAFLQIKNDFRDDVYDIPPGIDAEKFKLMNSNIRNEYSIDDSDKIILFVGRFAPLKNLPFLIEACKEIFKQREDVKLMLVGEGPLEKRIKKLVKNYKLQNSVIFTGRIDNDELAKYYSAANIFVMPSVYDNFPNAVLEAMACELPVVATNVGGIPMQVEQGENGFLIESGNVQQFKYSILTLSDDEYLAKEMGKRNRIKVKEKYNWEKSAKKLKDVYESIL
jgi:glycosyltransferase involved in cell wall biosynthesis